MEPRPRAAVRVLVVNDQDAVLLFRGFDPAKPAERYWFTPGGGLEPGEDSTVGGVRELREETGLTLTVAELGPPVHEEITDFSFNGVTYRQQQQFYLVRVGQWSVDTAGFDEWEVETIDGCHWWSIAELSRTEEIYHPRDLIEVLKRLGIPSC